jgi:hypothetical protein
MYVVYGSRAYCLLRANGTVLWSTTIEAKDSEKVTITFDGNDVVVTRLDSGSGKEISRTKFRATDGKRLD